MEESLSLLEKIKRDFEIKEVDINTYSPLTLAFIGDCIYDLVIRTVIVEQGNRQPQSLHKKKSSIVKAQTQALFIEALTDELDEKEADIYRRGRNAKSYTSAKNASIGDYRKATGFEALMGYLYLTGKEDRMLSLIKRAIELTGTKIYGNKDK
ncbi:MAG: ribonuclease III [Lachnospiraceae bacterium]|nr:ribonuclease III [Lachnospiraceae bacterium]